MAKQMAFYFEQSYCIGCMTCQVACKDKNDLIVGQRFRKVKEYTGGGFKEAGKAVIPDVYTFWSSISCNHCLNPVCVANCPTNALKKRAEDGIVEVDPDRCVGCLLCAKSCPYEAPQYNPDTGKIGKCNFCLDLLAADKPPACVAVCPLRVLDYGPLDKLQEKYGKVGHTQGLPNSSITRPALVITPHRNAIRNV